MQRGSSIPAAKANLRQSVAGIGNSPNIPRSKGRARGEWELPPPRICNVCYHTYQEPGKGTFWVSMDVAGKAVEQKYTVVGSYVLQEDGDIVGELPIGGARDPAWDGYLCPCKAEEADQLDRERDLDGDPNYDDGGCGTPPEE